MTKKLLNQKRAERILERENIDGLVVTSPINFYYVTGYWGLYYTPLGFDACYFSVMPKDNSKAPGMVLPALEIRRLETMGKPWIDNIVSYSSKGDGELFDNDFPIDPVPPKTNIFLLDILNLSNFNLMITN